MRTSARLDERIDEACQRFAPAPAVTDENETLSFRALAEKTAQFAALLSSAGLQRDEPVLVAMSNHATDFAALFATWKSGGVAVPLHRRSASATVTDVVSRMGVRFAVNARPGEAIAGINASSGNIVQQLRNAPPGPRDILRDAAWVLFTSGSTGSPKGVVHAHESYLAKLDAIQIAMALPSPQRVLLPLQPTFAYAQWVALTTLLRGGEVVIANPFRPAEFAQKLEENVDAIAVVPTMLRQLRTLIENKMCEAFAGTLMSGGEPLPAELGRFIRRHWPDAALWDIYGLTETSTSDFYVRPDEYDGAAGTIGRPAPGIEFRLSPGDSELQIRTLFLMRGYLDAPELTAAATSDGYFRTGDQARIRDDGNVEITGRLCDLVNRAGNKIAPLEIERVFTNHPDVADALATGLPDRQLGESLHVAVQPIAGLTLDPAALQRWASQHIDRHKLPDAIYVMGDLPTGATGKADRNALRAQLMAMAAPQETPG